MENNLGKIRQLALKLGATRVIGVCPKTEIIFEERAKLICVNSCERYGSKRTCLPSVSGIDYEKAVKEYTSGLFVMVECVFSKSNFETTRMLSSIKLHKILLALEKRAFNLGHYMTTSFIGGSCKLCSECGDFCKKPKMSRIPVEALGINVVETLNEFDIKVTFPVRKSKKFMRVGLILL